MYAHLYLAKILLKRSNISEKNIVQKIKKTFCVRYFFSENPAVCEIMRKNMVERDRPQMTVLLFFSYTLQP